ncbi:acetyl-CoA carboxylase biotin carboxyl carrier protein subunit [Microvirga sp. VF16]|uniref:acetyl-CoA carboxylase biotin carboxyl carrier protein n=1 Tax=Microvirga sp. VF16 TaxID=2807101 RepID=UPI00193CDCFB|nr:acetyl-CoA carboxylase biotin carboxyl carrier protein subunit [Microvirga sp. VF16]QRM29169.1 acetyl-CoA carboxylase biotin carboxyl carrier protein subunit [Microvirga sp. VF16]
MTLDEIKAAIDAMNASDLVEVEISKDGWTLRLTRDTGTAVPSTSGAEPRSNAAPMRPEAPRREPTPSAKPPSSKNDVSAPLSGIVYLGPSPDAPPFVAVGQAVTTGTTLCTVEAMKMFNPVTAERDGVVEAVFVTTGDEVAAGQPLLRIV